MSYFLEPMHFDFFTNRDRENNAYRTEDHPEGSFRFKYISTSRFERIIQDAKRPRTRDKAESRSSSSDYTDDPRPADISNASPVPRGDQAESDVDAESKRPREDAPRERNDATYKSRSVGVTRSDVSKKHERGKRADDETRNNVATSVTSRGIDGPWTLERWPVSRSRYRGRRINSYSELPPPRVNGRDTSRSGDDRADESESDDASATDGENEIHGVRLHPIIGEKIVAIQEKISSLLDEIDDRLSNVPLADGEGDLRRRQRCAMEFAIRFSRNYLYQLARQMADVKKHVEAVSPSASMHRSKGSARTFSLHVRAIEDKLVSAHQLLLQALNAYCKHIPSSVLRGQPVKIAQTKELLRVLVELINICGKLDLKADYFKRGDPETRAARAARAARPLGEEETEHRCAAIISKLRLNSGNEREMLDRGSPRSSRLRGFRRTKSSAIVDTNDCRKDSAWRLGMYKAGRNTKMLGKNLGENLANGKHEPSWRGLVGQGKGSSGVGATHQRASPSSPMRSVNAGPPVDRTISAQAGKTARAKIRSPPREDEIRTMMSNGGPSTDSDVAEESGGSGGVARFVKVDRAAASMTLGGTNATRRPSREHSSNDHDPRNTPRANVSYGGLSNLVPVIADLTSLVENQRTSRDVEIRPVSSGSMRLLSDFFTKHRSPSNLRTTTDKSAAVAAPNNMRFVSLSTEESKSAREPFRPGGILRLDEFSLEALSTYRRSYRDSSQSDPMYTSRGRNKPWDVVAWIADKLIEELIADLSKEFQLRDVIQKLFELEFQEF